jgi:hypothetical protein
VYFSAVSAADGSGDNDGDDDDNFLQWDFCTE